MKNSCRRYNSRVCRLLGGATLTLLAMQLLMVFVSWLITAAAPEAAVHSLLSSEGVRWFFAHFTRNLHSPVLVWLILVAVAGGSMARAYQAHRSSPSRTAMHVVIVELALFVVVLLMLSVVPHALLLSVTGSLFPSSFSDGVLAFVCLAITVCSLTYCIVGKQVDSVGEAYDVLCDGVRFSSVLIPIYIVAAQLYHSLLFVFGY